MKLNEIYNIDCLEGMKQIPDKSVDFILCDPPFGKTQNEWDIIIPFEPLWEQYNRIIKDDGVIAINSMQPFTSLVVTSNMKAYKYEWSWKKGRPTGHYNAKDKPLNGHETVQIFYKNKPTYNPQKTTGHKPVNKFTKKTGDGTNYGKTKIGISGGGQTDRFPTTVLEFPCVPLKDRIHPNQKPIEWAEYFIKTYTFEGDVVLDNCMGSATTAVGCIRTKRNYIGFEKDKIIYSKAVKRISNIEKVGEVN